MTKEEKARAYDEALERARSMYESRDDAELAAFIFPELAESEDEKIRKGLLKIFKQSQNGYWAGMEIKDIVAYLEKQKEQKPEWSQEDENRLNAVMELLENTSAIHPNYSHRKLIIWLKSLKDRLRRTDYGKQ